MAMQEGEALRRLLQDLPPERFLEMIDSLAQERAAERTRQTSPEQRERLIELYESYNTRHSFSPGQLVRWKAGLRNKKRPEYGVPGIVVEVLDHVHYDETENPASTYFREPLDIKVGLLDTDNDLIVYHFDSRKFEPFE